jgi:hypothetical protein
MAKCRLATDAGVRQNRAVRLKSLVASLFSLDRFCQHFAPVPFFTRWWLILLTGLSVAGLLCSPALASGGPPPVVNIKTYASASGKYALGVGRFGATFGLVVREAEGDENVSAVEAQPGNYIAFFEPFDSDEYDP